MRAYIIRRLLLVIPTIILASLVIFIIIRLIPGDIIDQIVTQMAGGYGQNIEEARDAIEHALGLDAPVIIQYGRWLGNIILHGDFGNSLWKDTPVIDIIINRIPVTLELGILAVIIAQIIALPIGIYSALRQDTWGDYITRSFAILCISVPSFWLGTVIVVFPSIWWGYSPPLTLTTFFDDPLGNLKQFIIPAVVLGMALSGVTMRMTRTMMLEVLRQDYIRTAWAKGLRERSVVIRHALKNALIPVVTIMGFQMSVIVGGSVIIEQIFCLPGMGLLIVTATNLRDYTIISGAMFFFATAMVLVNLVVDIAYSFLDPRIRYR